MELLEMLRTVMPKLTEVLGRFDSMNIDIDFGNAAAMVAAYILMGLGLFALAKNRCIKNPWLAWVPVGNLFLLGCVSDQYYYVTQGQVGNRRKLLLTLGIAVSAAGAILLSVAIALIAGGIIRGLTMNHLAQLTGYGVLVVVFFVLLTLELAACAVVLQVYRCICYYDLFKSCVPERVKLYSSLSIVASCLGIDLVAAIFIFLCRNKEDGMPPRVE